MAEDTDLGVESRRVRIVEKPVTPYLQWEMQYFRLLADAGEDLRVVDASRVRDWEVVRPLPEVVVLGDRLLFEVLYDTEGTPYGARRIDAPDAITQAGHEIARLHASGEPLLDYFRREIAPLSPPAV